MPEVQRYTHPHATTEHRLLDERNTHDGIIAGLIMTYASFLILTQTIINYSESIYYGYDSESVQIITHAPLVLAATTCDEGHQPPFVLDAWFLEPQCQDPLVF
ncbi:hypothetical protein N7510_002316 [Penicillium lagena]|uniref:uncharacterized protein n=1 Tax=Penicillium lagena TaxID=94218 RepID=UPI002540FBD9|nr:uncharacterized protein N7510_002316 [Penicillium lagena]KAJ5626007.1 hypothetical protein N7510_002316 [Penicillium lagena]